MSEMDEQQPLPPELQDFEQEWINELADVLARGYGSTQLSRGPGRPRKAGEKKYEIRSGIYRGVMTALMPVYEGLAEVPQEGSLYELGREAAKMALWDSRVPPRPE